jgi:serpin B
MKRRLFLTLFLAIFGFSFFVGFSEPEGLSGSLQNFGRKMEKTLSTSSQKNLIFSPWNLANLLVLTGNGAHGETATSFWKLLDLLPGEHGRNEAFKEMNLNLLQTGEFELSSAVGIWLQTGMFFNPLFQQIAIDDFQAELGQSEFRENPENARKKINKWVFEKTHGKIFELLKKRSVDKETRVVLASALYLNAPFLHPFNANESREENFNPGSSPSFPITFLHQVGTYRYLQTETFQLIEIPYKSAPLDVVLWVILPKGDFVEINPSTTDSLLKSTKIDLKLPKMEVRSSLDLRKSLETLGFTLPFSPEADFSGMVQEKISISTIVHEAYMGWDERGTEAAGASAAVFLKSAREPTEIVDFHADRPFSFLIWEKGTGIPLFQGKVITPTPWKGRQFLDKNGSLE